MKPDVEHLSRATIAEIEQFLTRRGGVGRKVLAILEQDPREGVRRLAVRERRKLRQREAEQRRLRRIREVEAELWASGCRHVAGVDEVGRGCLAGPVVAAAVVLPEGTRIPGINDSKQLEPGERDDLRQQIEALAISCSIAVVSSERIDRINILEASMEAMRIALDGLSPAPEHVLVDGNRSPASGYPETLLVEGDARSMSIAAASIIAKQSRDALMVEVDARHPGYGFASNKGYASADHRSALGRLGPCPEHRYSFSPLAERDQLQFGFEVDTPIPEAGVTGESVAAEFLTGQGYQIEDRRYRGAGGEIDLVARDGDGWVFVEVKTSLRGSRPEARLSAAQRRRLQRAAGHFLRFRAPRHDQPSAEARFDVIGVDLSTAPPAVEHWPDAFLATE